MNTVANITKLAEAIGWKLIDRVWHGKGSTWNSLMFNPFTNADDDYAVLVWAREKRGIPRDVGTRYCDFMFELGVLQLKRDEASSCLHEAYEIGDYARAALKVLEYIKE